MGDVEVKKSEAILDGVEVLGEDNIVDGGETSAIYCQRLTSVLDKGSRRSSGLRVQRRFR